MYPWEQKPKLDYITFMNTHVRVSVTIGGIRKGYFSVADDGADMNVDTIMPDGTPLLFKVEGHPRTTDPMMTAPQLVDYVLTNYKR